MPAARKGKKYERSKITHVTTSHWEASRSLSKYSDEHPLQESEPEGNPVCETQRQAVFR